MSGLKIQSLTAGYGRGSARKTVLKDISIQAELGQLIVLLGPNGSGKSTLLKTIAGLIVPSRGTLEFNGTHLNRLSLKGRAKTISYLAQARAVPPNLNAKAIVDLGRAPFRGTLGRLSDDGEAAVFRALEVTHSLDFKDRVMGSMSGGEQARVLLARALAVEAPILLADEPIAALDPYYQITMMETLKAEAQNGHLVITALHDLTLALQFADEIWVMQAGELVSHGTPQDALTPQTLKTVFRIKQPVNGFPQLKTAPSK